MQVCAPGIHIQCHLRALARARSARRHPPQVSERTLPVRYPLRISIVFMEWLTGKRSWQAPATATNHCTAHWGCMRTVYSRQRPPKPKAKAKAKARARVRRKLRRRRRNLKCRRTLHSTRVLFAGPSPGGLPPECALARQTLVCSDY